MAVVRREHAHAMVDPPCTDAHCSLVACRTNCTCKKNGWDVGHWVTVCDFEGNCCSCKCSCLLYGTPVQTPDGTRKIETFTVGEQVMAADTDFHWTPYSVGFSDGTDADVTQGLLVEVTTGTGPPLNVTTDHVFLVAGEQTGTTLLKQAIYLTPDDTLFAPDGTTIAIATVATKPGPAGVWHIATTMEKPTSPNGHLLNTSGIVSGDYALQLFFDELPKTYRTSGGSRVGDPDFIARHVEGRAEADIGDWLAPYELAPAARTRRPALLLNSDSRTTVRVPPEHAGYFTDLQAQRVSRTEQRPHDEAYMLDAARYLFTLYHAFYPDIEFVIDWASHQGNGYAIRTLGREFVLVQGGLLRSEFVTFESLALVIGQLIGYLNSTVKTDVKGFSCKAEADYFAVQSALRQLWFVPMFGPATITAIKRQQVLFDQIAPTDEEEEEEEDDVAHGCVRPSLQCRIDIYKSALGLLPMPPCGGGPTPEELEQLAATAQECECPT